MAQRCRHMQQDQPHERERAADVEELERVSPSLVLVEQPRQLDAEERHGEAVRVHHQIAADRQTDDQRVERPVIGERNPLFVRLQGVRQCRHRVRLPPDKARQHDEEDDQAQRRVHAEQGSGARIILREIGEDQADGELRDYRNDDEPVQSLLYRAPGPLAVSDLHIVIPQRRSAV
jgi:hypothetical protein